LRGGRGLGRLLLAYSDWSVGASGLGSSLGFLGQVRPGGSPGCGAVAARVARQAPWLRLRHARRVLYGDGLPVFQDEDIREQIGVLPFVLGVDGDDALWPQGLDQPVQ